MNRLQLDGFCLLVHSKLLSSLNLVNLESLKRNKPARGPLRHKVSELLHTNAKIREQHVGPPPGRSSEEVRILEKGLA